MRIRLAALIAMTNNKTIPCHDFPSSPLGSVSSCSSAFAPGPENLDGARDAGNNIAHAKVDPAQADNAFPNVARDFVSDPINNATFGKLSIRRTYTNNTGTTLTALRFRIINLSTFPASAGNADLRPMTSFAVSVPLTGGGGAVAEGTDLENPV